MKIPRVTTKNGRYYYIRDLEERKPNGRPKQKWIALTRVDEGEAALHAKLAEVLKEPEKPGGGNFAGWMKAWQKAHFGKLTPAVRKDYEDKCKVICEAFADFDVHQVEPGDIQDFVSRWDEHPTQRKSYKGRLSTFFSYCVLHQGKSGVLANPCREVKVKAPPKRKGKLTPELYWRIHDALPEVGQCFMDLMYLTRQRPTEIRLLKESAIFADHIHFEPSKTEKSSGEIVDVKRTPEIDSVLDRARKLRKVGAIGRGDAFVIQSQDGGPFTRWGIRSMWDRACEKAGVTGVTTRDIRPYALSTLEAMGVDLREIQKAAAHSDMSTTEGYLDQYRSRLVDVRMTLPGKKT